MRWKAIRGRSLKEMPGVFLFTGAFGCVGLVLGLIGFTFGDLADDLESAHMTLGTWTVAMLVNATVAVGGLLFYFRFRDPN